MQFLGVMRDELESDLMMTACLMRAGQAAESALPHLALEPLWAPENIPGGLLWSHWSMMLRAMELIAICDILERDVRSGC